MLILSCIRQIWQTTVKKITREKKITILYDYIKVTKINNGAIQSLFLSYEWSICNLHNTRATNLRHKIVWIIKYKYKKQNVLNLFQTEKLNE